MENVIFGSGAREAEVQLKDEILRRPHSKVRVSGRERMGESFKSTDIIIISNKREGDGEEELLPQYMIIISITTKESFRKTNYHHAKYFPIFKLQ